MVNGTYSGSTYSGTYSAGVTNLEAVTPKSVTK
jgi:hypothetical protein